MDSVARKQCATCKEAKPCSEFHKRARSKDGLQANCKECGKAATTAWWERQGRATYRAYHTAWRTTNRPRYRAIARAHYYRFREANIAKTLAYRQANRERVLAYDRLWRIANRKNTEYGRRRAARRRGVGYVEFTQAQLTAKLAYWGDQCWVCGGPVQAVDHVKPLSKGGPHCLANLRPICDPCNSTKHAKWPYPLVYERLGHRAGG